MPDPSNPTNDPNLPGYDPDKPTIGQAAGQGGVTTDRTDTNVQQAEPTTQPASTFDTLSNILLAVGALAFVGSLAYAIFAKD